MTRSLAVILVIAHISISAQAKYSGGSGDQNDPYQIANVDDLLALGADTNDYNKCFIMTTDIDFIASEDFERAAIAPNLDHKSYSFKGTEFTGVFEGAGHKISNIILNGDVRYYIGFFGAVGSTGQIRNLRLESANVYGSYNVGVLAGRNSGSISDCCSTGAVTGGYNNSSQIGGLVGFNDGNIIDCCSAATVTGRNGSKILGGMAGYNDGNIIACCSTGAVTGGDESWYLGGLAGINGRNISESFSTGAVTGGDKSNCLGGLAGYGSGGSISDSYSTGAVTGGDESSSIGGLVGHNFNGIIYGSSSTETVSAGDNLIRLSKPVPVNYGGGNIRNCYSTGTVSGTWGVGGLVGYSNGSISSSYFLRGSGPSNGYGKPFTSRQMKHQASFAGWDFVNTWAICEGIDYPKLAWNFSGNCPLIVTKCNIKRGASGDSISVSGLMSATDDDFKNADDVVVTFSAAPLGVLIPIHIQHFPINEYTYDNGSYYGLFAISIGGEGGEGGYGDWHFPPIDDNELILYSINKGTAKIIKTDPKSHFDYSVKTHKFKVTVKNADLTGLCSPVSMSIQVGSYIVGTEIDEPIINGKKPIPINLLMGVKNSLRVDKAKFTRDKKTGNITQVAVSGGFSVKDNGIDMVSETFSVAVGSQTFTIPAGKFKANKKGDSLGCARVLLPDGEVAAATFDFNKCTFTVTIKNTNFANNAGDAFLGIDFAGFSAGDVVSLP